MDLTHPEYPSGRATAIRGYHAIGSDLRRLFEYVEPGDRSLGTFSARIGELWLRSATDFEANRRAILSANDDVKQGNLKMGDCKKFEGASRLGEYKLKLSSWIGGNADSASTPLVEWQLAALEQRI